MSGQNFNDALASVMELGIPKEDAEECLKKNNGDVERAVNYFFNGDLERDRTNNRWDDSLFTQERYGPMQNPQQSGNSLNYLVQAADSLADPVGAKSRPPSPSRSFQIQPHDGDDADLQQAIKASMEDSQRSQQNFTGPQVTGTVGYTASNNFKRADVNTQYDSSSWAVTVAGPPEANAIEIFLDPSPNERKRVPEQPAFLRPGTGSGSLGPLLTILHSVPASRETLLQRDHLLDDYGQNEKWWSGNVIQLPRVVVEDDPDPIPPESVEVVRETQRIMAFLTGTERAYGTAESVGSLPGIFDPDPGVIISKYFMTIQDSIRIINNDPEMRTPLQSKAVRLSPKMEETSQTFEVFDLTIRNSWVEQGGSLYDALDALFWDEEEVSDGTETYAEYFGEICTIQVRCEDPSKQPCGIDVPINLYFDRYTKDFKEEISKMKKAKAGIQSQIEELNAKERKIRLYSPMTQPHRHLDMMKVMETTRKYFEQSSNPELANPEDEISSTEQARKCDEVAKQLAEIEARIQKKISDLKAQRDALREKLDKMKSIFTAPDNTIPGAPELTRYVLRGVSTDRGATYIRRKKLVPHIDLEDDNAPTEMKAQDEWWAMKYHTSQLAYSEEQYGNYEVKTVTEEEVLRAARFEGQGLVLLVYAKDTTDGTETEPVELPEPLKKFIAQDNEHFAKEVAEAASKPSKKRPLDMGDWSTDKNFNTRDYMKQWTQGGTVNSSRAATPGDSRRNSFDMGAEDDLRAIPEPPSPPAPPQSNTGGPSVHFAIDNEPQPKGFRGAYGDTHEVMAMEDGKPREKRVADDDDEMTYGSQHVEFAGDGTLQSAPMPVPPPPPQSPPAKKAPRFDLDE
ncbi:hypothetical protein H072_3428 [Dactylellina haptotyla CBS 200.50]|uniref:UBA domain-containing protein n=1 Tax=Dactylellina haptotyla (strain CBS 200.50) TaxID=1284197 RepID=S8BSU9_DACHA|nr:hypothetical protein H072_3428 [Dactylellina haptotyla CBS 200.50]